MSHVPPRTFGSLAPALVTPFNADGSLDLDSAQAIARKLASANCSGSGKAFCL